MKRILIIDDAMFMRKLIREALEPLGYEVVAEAGDGIAGLQAIEQCEPDLITLDIVMPRMDGLEVLRSLRRSSPHARVVMITAIDQRESMLEALKLGISDFIVKPFNSARVVAAVEKALRPQGGQAQQAV